MYLGFFQVFLLFPEAVFHILRKDSCTNVKIILLKILVSASLFTYVTIGQWLASRTLDLVSTRLHSVNESFASSTSKFDKFSGMDLSFMVNQVF